MKFAVILAFFYITSFARREIWYDFGHAPGNEKIYRNTYDDAYTRSDTDPRTDSFAYKTLDLDYHKIRYNIFCNNMNCLFNINDQRLSLTWYTPKRPRC